MRRLSIWSLCLALASAVPVCGTASAEARDNPKDKGNQLPGRARWEWKLFNAKGNEVDAGTFTGTVTGEVKKGDKVIGSWTAPAIDKVSVTFTDGPLKGKAELTQTKADPPTFEGEPTLADKEGKHKLVIKLVVD